MLASMLRVAFLWLSNRRWVARLALHTPLLRRVALRFVAGTALDDAVTAVRALNETGASATLDVLGESVHDRAAAERAAASYVATIERIATEGLEANVSLKLTQLGLDLGVEVCLEVLRPVVEAGRRHGIFVRIDMENSPFTQVTLDIFETMWQQEYRNVGIVLQSCLPRSVGDARRLNALGARVRIVKGAYKEPRKVAYQEKAQVDSAFVEISTLLLSEGTYPAIATHDPAMIDAVRAHAAKHGITPDRFEFQMLYGIRRDLQTQLRSDGFNVRVYVPFGQEWFPYFMRRLGERPANVGFVLRAILTEH